MKRFAGIVSLILVAVCAAAGRSQPPDTLGGTGKPDTAPLSGLAGRLGSAAGGRQNANGAPVTRFTPAGRRLSIDTFVSGLTSDPEQQKTLRQVLAQIFAAYEDAAKKNGFENDVAGALAFYLVTHYAVYHDGQQVSDATILVVARQLQGALDTPAMRATSDADKQRLYEFCVMLGGFTSVSYAQSAKNNDVKTRQGLKQLAGQALTFILKVAPERVTVGNDGLHVLTDSASAGAAAPATAPASGGKTGSVSDISYALPAEWTERKTSDVITLSNVNNEFGLGRSITVILAAGYARTGNLQDAARASWKELVESNFDFVAKPETTTAFVRRLPGGINCAFYEQPMRARANGAQVEIQLFLIENGDMVYPVLVMGTGVWSKYEDDVEKFLASFRVRGMVAARPLATAAELAGTWSTSSAAVASRVNSAGRVVGDATIATAETLVLNRDGTYSSSFTGYNAGAVIQQKTVGTFKIDGDLLVMTTKNGQVTKKRFLGLRKTEDGQTQMMLLNPAYGYARANIGLYGDRYYLKSK